MAATPPPIDHVIDMLLDAICVVDAQGRYVYVSAAFERIFGYRADEVLGTPMIDLVHPDDRQRTLDAAREIMDGQPHLHFRNRYLRKDGRTVEVMWSARWSERDGVRIAVARDVTRLNRAQAMQAALLAIAEAAHAAANLSALYARIHRIIADLLPATHCFVAITDGSLHAPTFAYAATLEGEIPESLSADAIRLASHVVESGQAQSVDAGATPPVPIRELGRDGQAWLGVPLRVEERIIGALLVHNGNPRVRYEAADRALLQFVCTQVSDAIERRRRMDRLHHRASHDPLTDLPNREHLDEVLDAALDGDPDAPLALLYLDLDDFKPVNDEHGHEVGDRLLVELSRRLREGVRAGDLVARLGGDEFAVVLRGLDDMRQAERAGENILERLALPLDIGDARIRVTASIGIACHPQHGGDRRQLLHRADQAMYLAKRCGGNRVMLSPASAEATPSGVV